MIDILHTPGMPPADCISLGVVNWWIFIGFVPGAITGLVVSIMALFIHDEASDIGGPLAFFAGPIFGIVLGPLFIVGLIWFFYALCRDNRRRKNQQNKLGHG